MTEEENKIYEALETKFKDVQTKLQEAQASGEASKKEIEDLHKSIKEQGEALDEYVESQKEKQIASFSKQLQSFLEENKEELETIKKRKTGTIEFTPKVVADMSTGSGSIVGTVPANNDARLGSFNLRNDDSLLSVADVSSTGSAVFPYTELTPKDGDYTFVAEGGTKPQVDFKWETRYAEPRKVAAHEILSEEVMTDVPRMMSVAREYLFKKHNLFKASKVYFGTGIAPEVKGATVYGRTFVAGSMALAVTTPNFMDVVNACVTDIYTTHNYTDEASYEANIVLINPVDFFIQLVSAKDANGLPLYPQAGLFNQVTIGGVTIKPWSKIPAGKIFVADMKQYKIANYIPYSVRIGWINDNFITNEFAMVGESRFYAYVRNLDEQAFIYDTIATIKTAITKI